ncbi:MAG: hypothetical protein PHF86_01730 [Candidatus Nanoarchaeia archaeon]|nr:hypothetical protein [Candidatus Nanoarchaeia archaeon]
MKILTEITGLILLLLFFSFPIWINKDNWKTFFNKEYFKQKKKLQKTILPIEYKNKICSQYQPFKLSKKKYVICNFLCDGECIFKGTKFYIEK